MKRILNRDLNVSMCYGLTKWIVVTSAFIEIVFFFLHSFSFFFFLVNVFFFFYANLNISSGLR